MRPKEFLAAEHEIDPAHIDPDALSVIEKLRNAGHTAYLVGGSVRDLLVHRKPKDFDISTSAQPQEIKRIFRRNCFLIGKRFRLAHIRFGKKVIEVSTFRSGENAGDLIIQDNKWGTEEEDVLRRDFTINGLFYDPVAHKVIDYVGGWNDIHQGVLKCIGDPIIRFKQDPVRMLRLIKFRARFGFTIEEQTKKALIATRKEIVKSSPARILEEILRMLESGASAQFFNLMTQAKMLHLLFPPLTDFIESNEGRKIFELLQISDQINQQEDNELLSRPVLTSCLLFPILDNELRTLQEKKGSPPHLGEVILIANELIKKFVISSFSHFPRKLSTLTTSIMTIQYRMTPLSGKQSIRHKCLAMKEFPDALQFLKIRAVLDPNLLNPYKAWNNAWRQHLKKGVQQKQHHPPPLQKS